MEKNIYLVMDFIEKSGYKVFLVGGYVRDSIWNVVTNDIDMCTDAPSDVLLDIFSDYKPKLFKYDSIKFNIENLHFDISRMRKEEYSRGKLVVSYSNDIYDDYLRRDFTFNGIYMNKSGNIFTFDSSYKDVIEKRICFIGKPSDRINEDPSRLLRYIYIALKNDLMIEKLNFSQKKFFNFVSNKRNNYIVEFYLNKIKKINKPELLKKYIFVLALDKKLLKFFNWLV